MCTLPRRPAAALKALDKVISGDKPPARAVYELRAQLLGQAGWAHWQRHEQGMLLVRFPRDWPPL